MDSTFYAFSSLLLQHSVSNPRRKCWGRRTCSWLHLDPIKRWNSRTWIHQLQVTFSGHELGASSMLTLERIRRNARMHEISRQREYSAHWWELYCARNDTPLIPPIMHRSRLSFQVAEEKYWPLLSHYFFSLMNILKPQYCLKWFGRSSSVSVSSFLPDDVHLVYPSIGGVTIWAFIDHVIIDPGIRTEVDAAQPLAPSKSMNPWRRAKYRPSCMDIPRGFSFEVTLNRRAMQIKQRN